MSPLPGSKQWLPATVLEHHRTPRSYVVECNRRKYRRNRKFLRLSTHEANKVPRVVSSESMNPQLTEVKTPTVPVKSTGLPAKPSQTATSSNKQAPAQQPNPETTTTPNSKPASAPQKPRPVKSPSPPMRRNPPRNCGPPKKLNL
jgi:hypothetical protein